MTETQAQALKEFKKYIKQRYFADYISVRTTPTILDLNGNPLHAFFLKKVLYHWNYEVRPTPLSKDDYSYLFGYDAYNSLYAATSRQFIPLDYNPTPKPFKPYLVAHDGDGAITVNTWRPFHLANQECYQHPPAEWFAFLDSMFPSTEEEGDLIQRTVVQYLAHLLRYPSQRGSWALLMPSEQGTGKGVLFNKVIAPMINERLAIETSFTRLFSGFGTQVIADNLLVLIDDPQGQGTTKDVHNALKSIISEPVVRVERKGENAFMSKAYARFVLATNNQVPFRLPSGDRRWFVTDHIKHEQDKETTLSVFIRPLLEWLYPADLQPSPNVHSVYDDAKMNCIYQWFINQDLSDFDPYMPPYTAAKGKLMEMSKTVDDQRFEAFGDCISSIGIDAFHHEVVKSVFELAGGMNDKATNSIKSRLTELGFLYCPKLSSQAAKQWETTGGAIWYKHDVLGRVSKGKVSVKHTEAASVIGVLEDDFIKILSSSGLLKQELTEGQVIGWETTL